MGIVQEADMDVIAACAVFLTFSLNGGVDESAAFINMVGLLIKLQRGFVLCVVDVDDGAGVPAQQRVHRHAQLHVEPLGSLKHLVIVNDYGAHLGVLTLIKLYL